MNIIIFSIVNCSGVYIISGFDLFIVDWVDYVFWYVKIIIFKVKVFYGYCIYEWVDIFIKCSNN